MKNKAFTLVELLVVIAMFGILVVLIGGAISRYNGETSVEHMGPAPTPYLAQENVEPQAVSQDEIRLSIGDSKSVYVEDELYILGVADTGIPYVQKVEQ